MIFCMHTEINGETPEPIQADMFGDDDDDENDDDNKQHTKDDISGKRV